MKIYLDNNLGVTNVEQEELTQDTIGYNILKVYIPNAVLTPYDTFTCYYGALLQNGRKVGWFAMEARTSTDADYEANYTLYKATLEQCIVSVEGKVYIGCQILLGNSGNATLIKKNTAVVQFNVRKSVAINNDILVLDTDQTTTDVLESYKNLLENALTTYATKATTYTKTEVNSALALKADKSDTYTKTEVDTKDLNLAGQIAGARVELNNRINTTDGILTATQAEVAKLKSVQNVVEVVATKSALNSYDTTKLDVNDKVQVIADESHDGASTIYNWNGSAWQYVGAFGGNSYTKAETYNKTQIDSALSDKADKSNTYTRAVIDSMILTLSTDKADKSTTYTKTEIDGKFEEVGQMFEIVGNEVEKKADKTTVEEINTRVGALETGIADDSIEWKNLTSDVRNAVFNDVTYLLPFVQSALIGDATWDQNSGEVEWREKSNRLTISGIMYIKHSAVLYNSSASYGFNIFYYTGYSDSDYSSRTGYSYTTGYNIIPAGSYFRIVFRASDDSNITISNITGIFSLYISNEDYNTWVKSFDTNYLIEQSKIKCAFSGNTEDLSSDLIIDNHIGLSTTSYYNIGTKNRAMTRYIYYAFTDLTISIDDYDTYKNNVIYYNSSGTYLSRTTNLAYRVIIPKGSYFRIMFSKIDDTEMDSTDISTLESIIHLENFAFTKIMDITASVDNPTATQQSASTDGDNIYITFPSDTGTHIGAVQQYNKGGILLKEISNLTTVHASQTAYYNGDLYILGDKSKATTASIFKVDLISGELSTITLTMQSEMVWDGFTIYGGYAYLVGFDYTASISSQQPTNIVFEIVDLNTLTSIKVINATLPSHTHFGTQGLAINGFTAYVITSEAYDNQEWKPGLCIDKYDLLDGSVESSVFSSNFFYEPEGCFILDDYVCTTLANHGGVYRILKIEK